MSLNLPTLNIPRVYLPTLYCSQIGFSLGKSVIFNQQLVGTSIGKVSKYQCDQKNCQMSIKVAQKCFH